MPYYQTLLDPIISRLQTLPALYKAGMNLYQEENLALLLAGGLPAALLQLEPLRWQLARSGLTFSGRARIKITLVANPATTTHAAFFQLVEDVVSSIHQYNTVGNHSWVFMEEAAPARQNLHYHHLWFETPTERDAI